MLFSNIFGLVVNSAKCTAFFSNVSLVIIQQSLQISGLIWGDAGKISGILWWSVAVGKLVLTAIQNYWAGVIISSQNYWKDHPLHGMG